MKGYGVSMKNKSYIIYILGAIIGFLAFAFSMNYAGESKQILILLGIAGMSGMGYCIKKLFNSYLTQQEKK